ncbi:MAG: hypothetical protein Q8O34_15405 [Rhodocyclaceae bacterium]|nr:hypothetical protein [Rhodocyclaceae bacterium]
MTKTYKNIPSLHRFVELAPVEAIRKLLAEHGGGDAKAFASVEWPDAPPAATQNPPVMATSKSPSRG